MMCPGIDHAIGEYAMECSRAGYQSSLLTSRQSQRTEPNCDHTTYNDPAAMERETVSDAN